MTVFARFESRKGGVLRGDSVQQGRQQGWIEIYSFQWGVGRTSSGAPGGSESDREGSAPSVSEITVSKPTGPASARLMQACANQEIFKSVTLEFSGAESVYPTIRLTNGQITRVHPRVDPKHGGAVVIHDYVLKFDTLIRPPG